MTFSNPRVMTDCGFHPCVRSVSDTDGIVFRLLIKTHLPIASKSGNTIKFYHLYPLTVVSRLESIDTYLLPLRQPLGRMYQLAHPL